MLCAQCSPPLLSATWFGSSERATATATAINFNQVGIATAFIVGGLMANDPAGMTQYFDVITIGAASLAVLTALFFRDKPDEPPSASAAKARAFEESNPPPPIFSGLAYPKKALDLLGTRGFRPALATFVASIGCTNVISAFTAPELARAGFTPGFDVDLAGAGFQFAIVAGGIALGKYVDNTKDFYKVLMGCLFASIGFLTFLGISEGYDRSFAELTVAGALFFLGFLIGPVQPISAELAVEVAYPCDENAVEATQQLAGNLFSALLVPICATAARFDLQAPGRIVDVRGDTLVLLGLVTLTTLYFSSFDAPLARTAVDKGE